MASGERSSIIGGAARPTGRIVEVRSPWSGEVVARVHRAGPREIEEAVAAAVAAFPATRRMASHERAGLLERMAAGIDGRGEELARLLVAEAGKPIKVARIEVARCGHTFRAGAEEARRIGGEVLPLDVVPWGAGRIGLTRRFPVGPVLGITPFNFPLNLPAHKIAPALATGCPIVLKPASQTPSPAIVLAEIAADAGAPPGAFSVVTAPAEEAQALAADERFRMLSFTGSGAVGWELKRRAGKKKVALELGGNAAAIVCEGTEVEFAAERVAAGGFSYAGQSCISVQRVFVQKGAYDGFRAALLAKVSALRVGDPLDETTDVGPMIARSEAERVEAWIAEALAGGARLAAGGGRQGALLAPTVLENTTPEMKVNCAEIFAPVITLTPFDSLEQALGMTNASAYGLQAGIFTPAGRDVWRAFEALEVGGVIVNDVPTWRVDHMPYGGVKDSGSGREGLRYAIEEMTELRLLVWSP